MRASSCGTILLPKWRRVCPLLRRLVGSRRQKAACTFKNSSPSAGCFCHGRQPQERVWRRNAMNTAETRQSLFKKQPARSQTGCRLLFVVDSADYLPRRPRPWFTIRWISAFISRMISRAMDCILVSKIAGTDCVNSPIIIPCLSKMLCPKGES